MQEIELKFQIPEGALNALTADIERMPGHAQEHLQAHYFDTLERRLGQARSALRLRKEGPRWVQTLKAVGANTMMRLEDNQAAPAPAPGSAARIDLGLHRGSPAEAALIKHLGWQPDSDPTGQHTGLIELYRTDIWRQTARLSVGQGTPLGGTVELALDLGHIHGGDLSMAVRELEIELVDGHPMAVIEAARSWVVRHGLWLDTRTKAHRGDGLARQAAGEVAQNMSPTKTDKGSDLAACLEHLTDHMSCVASGLDDPATHTALWRQALQHMVSLPASDQAMPATVQLLQALEQTNSPVELARSPSSTLLCLDLFAALLPA